MLNERKSTPRSHCSSPDTRYFSCYSGEQVVKTPIVYFDNIYNQWLLLPQFAMQFEGQLAVIEELRQIVNQKWTPEQLNFYVTFLNDLSNYLVNYVFTLQVHYYEDFLYWIEYVKTQYNPVGFELYEKQLDYFQKKMEGYDFKQDKKKNKDPNAPKQ